jgi:hypothetical protein
VEREARVKRQKKMRHRNYRALDGMKPVGQKRNQFGSCGGYYMSKLAPFSTTFSLPESVEIRVTFQMGRTDPCRFCAIVLVFSCFSLAFPFWTTGLPLGSFFGCIKVHIRELRKVGGNYREILFIRQICTCKRSNCVTTQVRYR